MMRRTRSREAREQAALPAGWMMGEAPAGNPTGVPAGTPYYYNVGLDVSQWEVPRADVSYGKLTAT
jgi:hypothetical protein